MSALAHLRTTTALLLGVAGVWLPMLASAADTGPPPAPANTRGVDPLTAARMAVQAQQWPAALEELRKVNASGALTNNADWNNLMGYSMRKQAQPDLDTSQRYYEAALRIDPQHRGALEYSGELALMKGDLPTAQTRLAALAKLCSSPCEPLDDLKKSIERYTANAKM